MSTLEESDWPGFGLSLPRMFLWLRGKEPRRAERSALEAYAIGTFMYLLYAISLQPNSSFHESIPQPFACLA